MFSEMPFASHIFRNSSIFSSESFIDEVCSCFPEIAWRHYVMRAHLPAEAAFR